MDKFAWTKALRGAEGLTHAEFRVLVILSTYTDANLGNAFPGRQQLFDAACVSMPTGKKALKSLIEKGWVVLVEEGGNQHWKGKANVYAVTVPKGVSHLPPSGQSDVPDGTEGGNSLSEGGKPFSEGGKSVTPHQDLSSNPSIKEKNIRSAEPTASMKSTPLSDSWQPNKFHRSTAKKLHINIAEAAHSFRARMAGEQRSDWDKTFGAYLNDIDRGIEDTTFTEGDYEETYDDDDGVTAPFTDLFGDNDNQDDMSWLSEALCGMDEGEVQAARYYFSEGLSRYKVVDLLREIRKRQAS